MPKKINITKIALLASFPLLFSYHSFANQDTASVGLKWTAQVESRNCTSVEVSNQKPIEDMSEPCQVTLELTPIANNEVITFSI